MEEMIVVVGETYCGAEERQLTVRKTSVFYPGDGFAAYEHSTGELVFRVDTYGRGPALATDLVLMDPSGASILTLRKKWPSLHQRWEGYLGDRMEGQKPLFTVKRSSIFGGERAGVVVEVHDTDHAKGTEYRIEGSFAHRCCRLLYLDNKSVEDRDEQGSTRDAAGVGIVAAEIKRKVDEHAHVVLSKDVFCLHIRPHFDAAFAMGLVLVLDQISGDDDVDNVDDFSALPDDNQDARSPSS
ncbi:LURP-one-related protein [Dioscorea alata]|uniref:LURP-one-related protein n=1 Tax=Dioscorea alata TaxID=55571 RepID=A0ACB7WG28_DIOAL|nr:LURP-one-related protein [Dioscorea alata]